VNFPIQTGRIFIADLRLLPASFLAVAMTDHFFGGECGEKEAGHQFSVKAESPPASFSPHSQNQQHTVIASRNDEAIY
ncbi:MAG: hypothetical protein M1445_09535, partial [Bacteroidetes bacterium]|nr:hypothetical protein [Bacteroidota bacterium]